MRWVHRAPDATRRRVVEVHSLADEILIYEESRLIARHPMLEGRRQRSLLDGHRRTYRQRDDIPVPHGFMGDLVTRRATRTEARQALFGYIEGYYNRHRMHSALGYLTPEQAEQRLTG